MRRKAPTSIFYSCLFHAVLLSTFLISWTRVPRLEPTRLPGTPHGSRLLTYYSPGGTPAQAASAMRVPKHGPRELLSSSHVLSTTSHVTPFAAKPSDPGLGEAGLSGLGQGDINIALQKFFPSPRPDLSTLSHGQKGDVVVNAVIDADGSIKEVTVLKSLNPAIDSSVLAAVRRWTYTPATKDGQPVPSEQELHFHFERG